MPRAEAAADLIADRVTGDRTEHCGEGQPPDGDDATVREVTGNEEHRLAGERNAEEQRRLRGRGGEDDDDDPRVRDTLEQVDRPVEAVGHDCTCDHPDRMPLMFAPTSHAHSWFQGGRNPSSLSLPEPREVGNSQPMPRCARRATITPDHEHALLLECAAVM